MVVAQIGFVNNRQEDSSISSKNEAGRIPAAWTRGSVTTALDEGGYGGNIVKRRRRLIDKLRSLLGMGTVMSGWKA